MKKIFSFFALISIFILGACSQNQPQTKTTWEKIQERGTLKVATPGTLFPTSYYNDKKELVGYEIEMLKEIGKRLNVSVEFVQIGVAEAFTSVDSGVVDIAVNNFDITKDRLNKYNMSEPYKYSVGGMIVREDGSSGLEKADLSDWKGKRAGGGAGTQYMKISEKLGAIPVIYDNVTNDVYLRDVHTGRTDFIPNDYFTQVVAVEWVKKAFPDIKVKVSSVQYNPTEQAIVMTKVDNSVKEKLDAVIQEMKKDGTLKQISEKYYAKQDLSKPIEHGKNLPVIDTSKE
ncbi:MULTISPECIES: transporter substrate-binding domain-containing protein [unclassified Granulicatella]|uniref:transporter substrate-binding domain-containing protein n=1 Tax=unclassified Granulicatella TaxID=2630493 RepID=UPI00107398C3|nr:MULTISPECIES: transporter substrate-binding domain-containing protein [unclassified Granulicatella]MBF0779570.1 transporter substrate-binding domain-containing protein [Granulicatella sp. 19428wC4_WM01]TFU96374.1 transporter substrate-binding domain-containing protein [Granulicatella sp. WM01]